MNKYKELLDRGTVESSGIEDETISRFQSFLIAKKLTKNKENIEILELGTCRSFVDGKYEGCNSDDIKYWEKDNFAKWDWGAGCFSLVFGQEIPHANITTVDLMKSHIFRCKTMTVSLGINSNHVVMDSVKFLSETDKKNDLIYLDTGDMTPIEPTSNLQLDEVRIIVERDLLKPNGILLIDDVLNKTPKEHGDLSGLGKSKYSIPFLLENGYKTIFKGYQYIFTK